MARSEVENNGNLPRKKNVTLRKPLILGSYAFQLTLPEKKKLDMMTHRWSVLLRSYIPDEDISYFVKKVFFELDPTFSNPKRVVTSPPYEVCEIGWGEFYISVKIFFVDETIEPLRMSHYLKLNPTNPNHNSPCVASETYDECIFYEPHEWFYEKVTSGSQCPPINHRLQQYFLNYSTRERDHMKYYVGCQSYIQNQIKDLAAESTQLCTEIQKLKGGYCILTLMQSSPQDIPPNSLFNSFSETSNNMFLSPFSSFSYSNMNVNDDTMNSNIMNNGVNNNSLTNNGLNNNSINNTNLNNTSLNNTNLNNTNLNNTNLNNTNLNNTNLNNTNLNNTNLNNTNLNNTNLNNTNSNSINNSNVNNTNINNNMNINNMNGNNINNTNISNINNNNLIMNNIQQSTNVYQKSTSFFPSSFSSFNQNANISFQIQNKKHANISSLYCGGQNINASENSNLLSSPSSSSSVYTLYEQNMFKDKLYNNNNNNANSNNNLVYHTSIPPSISSVSSPNMNMQQRNMYNTNKNENSNKTYVNMNANNNPYSQNTFNNY